MRHHWRDFPRPPRPFIEFADELQRASNDTLLVELVWPRYRTDAIDGEIARPTPPRFAAEPIFMLLADSSASFDSAEQRHAWLTDERGRAVVREIYSLAGVHFVGAIYYPPALIRSQRPLHHVEDLGGTRMLDANVGVARQTLARCGVTFCVPRPIPRPQGPQRPSGSDQCNSVDMSLGDWHGWSWTRGPDVGYALASGYAIDSGASMPIRAFALWRQAWERLSADQQTLLQSHVLLLSDRMRRFFEDAALVNPAIVWPAAERAKLRAISNRVQDEIAAGSEPAQRIVGSIRAYQRRLGLI